MKIALCVVGCGNFARTFAKSIQPLRSEVNLYFASRSLSRAETYSRIFNGSGAFGSYEEAAHSKSIQAMYICTPHHMHLEHSTLAATNGKHILIEKPISNTVISAKQIIETAATYKVNLMVAENARYIPVVTLCKKLVSEQAIGNIRLAQIQEQTSYKSTGWRNDPIKNGGGVFIDAGIHKVHVLRYLLGDPSTLYAVTPGECFNNYHGEDGIVFVAKWDSGAVGLINHSWTASTAQTYHWTTISGTHGNISFEMKNATLQLDTDTNSDTIKIPDHSNGLLLMAKEFVSSIQQGRTPDMSGEEGAQDLELVMKAYQSIQEKRSLTV